MYNLVMQKLLMTDLSHPDGQKLSLKFIDITQ